MAGRGKDRFRSRFFKGLNGAARRLSLLAAGLAVTAALSALHWSNPGWLAFLDYKVYDVLLKARPKQAVTGLVTVVDLDEKSLAEVGQWPWPRYQGALLLARLKQYGVLAVGLDTVFAEPDRASPERIRRELQGLGVDMDFTGLPEKLRDNDALLAETLAAGPYVLGYFFTFKAADSAGADAARPLLPPEDDVHRPLSEELRGEVSELLHRAPPPPGAGFGAGAPAVGRAGSSVPG